jgi:hypothetical protein
MLFDARTLIRRWETEGMRIEFETLRAGSKSAVKNIALEEGGAVFARRSDAEEDEDVTDGK